MEDRDDKSKRTKRKCEEGDEVSDDVVEEEEDSDDVAEEDERRRRRTVTMWLRMRGGRSGSSALRKTK